MSEQSQVDQPMTVPELMRELDGAMAQYSEAELAEAVARGRLTEATNRLNAAQKAIDRHLNTLKSKAPRNSDWKQKHAKSEPAT